jgi:hypothetical protein
MSHLKRLEGKEWPFPSGEGSALMSMRSRLKIDPIQQVRLAFEPESEDAPSSTLTTVLRCATCNEEFSWNVQASWWVCLSCGIELTPDEVTDLLEAAKRALKVLNTDVGEKRGGRWHWVLRLLGRLHEDR